MATNNCECIDPGFSQPDYCPPCGPDIPCPPTRPLPPMPGWPCPPPKPDCSNKTPNYGLPLWRASDVTSWLMQMNGAMLRIDTIMHDLALRTGINGLPDDLVTTVSKLCQDVGVLQCTVGELQNKTCNMELLMQNLNTSMGAIKTDIASIQLNLTNMDTRIMTVDSANQQLRNDMTLVKSDLNMLSNTVTNLQSNVQQFQQATNSTLAEHTAAISELQNDVVEQQELTENLYGSIGADQFKYIKIASNPEDLIINIRSEQGLNGKASMFSLFGHYLGLTIPFITSITSESVETINDYVCMVVENVPEIENFMKTHTCTGAVSNVLTERQVRSANFGLVREILCAVVDPADNKIKLAIYIDPMKNNIPLTEMSNILNSVLGGCFNHYNKSARYVPDLYTPEEMYNILKGGTPSDES